MDKKPYHISLASFQFTTNECFKDLKNSQHNQLEQNTQYYTNQIEYKGAQRIIRFVFGRECGTFC